MFVSGSRRLRLHALHCWILRRRSWCVQVRRASYWRVWERVQCQDEYEKREKGDTGCHRTTWRGGGGWSERSGASRLRFARTRDAALKIRSPLGRILGMHAVPRWDILRLERCGPWGCCVNLRIGVSGGLLVALVRVRDKAGVDGEQVRAWLSICIQVY